MSFEKVRRLLKAIEDINNNEDYYKEFRYESDGSRAYSSSTDAINDLLESVHTELNELEKEQPIDSREDLSDDKKDTLEEMGEWIMNDNSSLEEKIAKKKYHENNRKELIDFYEKTREMSPADTLRTLVNEVGLKQAIIDVAECINATSDDGRISDKVKEWAKGIDCASKEELEGYNLYSLTSWIHPSHLNQIAEETIRFALSYYEIYQINRELPDGRDLSFISYADLEEKGLKADPDNYSLVYSAKYNNEGLDEIYEIFNVRHPGDFRGHSLSVSDVVVIHSNGEDRAYYVDSFGFEQVPEFLQTKERQNEKTTGMTLTQYSGLYIDKDIWDKEVDVCVGFVLDREESSEDDTLYYQDQFLSYLADNVIVVEGNPDSYICDFSGFFKKHQDELKELYEKAQWRLEDEFDEDEIHYDFVSSVLPQMVSGNSTDSTYKAFLNIFCKDDQLEKDSEEKGDMKKNEQPLETKDFKKEIITILGKVFAEYSKGFDPQNSTDDERTLLEADKAYNYLVQLVNAQETNQGYKILDVLKQRGGDFSFAIGYNKKEPNPYVVWTYFKDKYNGKHYSSGTYVNSLYEAALVQAEKADLSAYKNDLFDIVNMTLCIDKKLDRSLSKNLFNSKDISDTVKYYVDQWRSWDKTLDDDIRDYNTLDSMDEFIEEKMYTIEQSFIELETDESKGAEL